VLAVDSRDYVRLSVLKDEIMKNPHRMPLKPTVPTSTA